MYKVYSDDVLICDSRTDDLAIIEPIVTLAVNSAGSFTFTIPSNHPRKDVITTRESIISVYIDDDETPIFRGIVTELSEDFFGQKSYVCEGELTYLNDTVLRPAKRDGLTAYELLSAYITEHNEQVNENRRFKVGYVSVPDTKKAYCYTNYNSTLTEIKEDLIDDYGGYIRVRYAIENGKLVSYIDYLTGEARTAEQTVELGKNLLTYSSNIDDTEIATAIIPLGVRLEEQNIEGLDARLDIKSVNGGKDYVYNSDAVKRYGWIFKKIENDDITLASNLKTWGQSYLTDVQFENVVIECSMVDFGYLTDRFDRFRLLDSVRVKSDLHGMDRRFIITEQKMELNHPEKDSVVLGDSSKIGLSARTAELNRDLDVRVTETYSAAVMKATGIITGNQGGYVYFKLNSKDQPEELYVMDTNNPDTAKNVWRWNKSGIGYSSKGINGPYSTAWTIDGNFNCDYLHGGTIELGGVGNGNGTLEVKNASGNNTALIDNAGIRQYTYNGSKTIESGLGSFSAYIQSAKSTQAGFYCKKDGGSVYIAGGVDSTNVNGTVVGWNSAVVSNGGNLMLIAQNDNDGSATTGKVILEPTMFKLGFPTKGTNYSVDAQFSKDSDGCHLTISGTNGSASAPIMYARAYNNLSDKRLKDDIDDLAHDESVKIINSLKPKKYTIIDEHEKRIHHGFIAQDVEGVIDKDFAFYASENKQFEYKSLSYTEIIADLVNVAQDQYERIKSLETKLADLEGKVNG